MSSSKFLLRNLILGLFCIGFGVEDIREIVEEVGGVSLTDTAIYKYRIRGKGVKNRAKKPGRPGFWTSVRKKKLAKELERLQRDPGTDFEVTGSYLKRKLRFSCGISCIRKELNRQGYHWRAPKNYVDIDSKDCKERRDFCREFGQKRISYFYNTLFLDEKKFTPTNTPASRIRRGRQLVRGIYRKKGQATRFCRPSKHDMVSKTTKVLGGFLYNCEKPLVLWSIYKTFNSKVFVREILKVKRKHPQMNRICLDAHRAHTSRYTRGILEDHGLELIFLPKRSPDLSCMDFACWNFIERCLNAKKMGSRVETLKVWNSRLMRTARSSVGKPYVLKVLRSFLSRLAKCLNARGDRFRE